MSVIMVIIDGAMPEDYKECFYISKASKKGYINNVPKDFESNSLSCIMNMLMVPDRLIPKGRAYLETLAFDLNVKEDDLIFRCNNVNIVDNMLVGNEAKTFNLSFEEGELISLSSYKNLLIIHNRKDSLNKLETAAPHEHLGENIYNILPKGEDKALIDFLRNLIFKYNLYPWGEAVKVNFPSFKEMHGYEGAVVCQTEIVKGIAKGLNMYCPNLKEGTADIDTNLKEKTKKALKLKDEFDFVLLHINGADESAHRKNKKEKLKFIKSIDEVVIKELINNVNDDTSIIVTSDHGTSSLTGGHLKSDVSYFIFNESKEADYWLRR